MAVSDAILKRLVPLVDAWHFTDLPSPRAAAATDIAARWRSVAGDASRATVATHRDPPSALAAAVAAADPADRILVFGSFYTVGGVLEHGLPLRAGRHVV